MGAKFDSILAKLDSANGYPSTKYQIDIYKALFKRDSGNLIVEAVAGSGKSTTIRNGLAFLPEWSSNVIIAFNSHIAAAMTDAGLPANCVAMTANAAGSRAITASLPQGTPRPVLEKYKTYDIIRAVLIRRRKELEQDIEDQKRIVAAAPTPDALDREVKRLNDLANEEISLDDCESPINRIVSLLKSQACGCASEEMILYLVDRFGLDWNRAWLPLTTEVYETGLDQRAKIDFDDQLLFSLEDNVSFPHYDNIFVDETQDLNPINIDVIAKMARLGSTNPARIIFVGDSRQSIYGFRGADPQAIAEIRTRFQTRSLPLNVSWRCGKAIIAAAQMIVPHIEAAPNAEEGEIVTVKELDFYNTVQDGDYVLCRITSPLVSKCLKMLAKGRKATVLGREIGGSLVAILKKFGSSEYNGLKLQDQITYFEQLELGRISGTDVRAQTKSMMIVDKCEALRAICEECKTVHQAMDKIEMIFSEKGGRGVTFSTIHKAKGLEADRIFIIRPDLMPLPHAKQDWELEQEENLRYVATTRARRSLFYVTHPKESKNRIEA